MTATQDQLNRFLFDEHHVRGELVQLDNSYQALLVNHNYPDAVKVLLGELMAASCLLTATIKFEGDISIQLQGNGPISYMVINGDHKQQMRGVARINDKIPATNKAQALNALIGKGNMIITITPNSGQRYQGIVALEKPTIAECLADYFLNSEQIPTTLWLYCDGLKSAGALIQLLPDSGSKEQQQTDYEHICQLTNTIKQNEIFELEANDLLYRLFHQEQVKVFEPQAVSFRCGCSEEKCLTAVHNIPKQELAEHLAEHGHVSITCEFCLTEYKFNKALLTQG